MKDSKKCNIVCHIGKLSKKLAKGFQVKDQG
jgi:hypothetical protein